MLLQKIEAKKGNITESVRKISEKENVPAEKISESVAKGRTVILTHKNICWTGIGDCLHIKVNANLGTSPNVVDVDGELSKLDKACQLKTDTVMDLSTGGNLDIIREKIVQASPVPVGSVPIYQADIETVEEKGSFSHLTAEKIFRTIEKHAESGISFVTVHCGITLENLEMLKKSPRKTGVVSRGGSFIFSWMALTGKENPLYENFDRLIEIAKKYDLVLSLGDGLRPGCISDATDNLQISEVLKLGKLAGYANEEGVQVIIEGPGHVPINQIFTNVQIVKNICASAPLYLLGPLVTDIAPGYDHITSAIGAAVAGWAGADFICYVTPGEHLTLPTIDDVADGVVAAKIAAHAGDIARDMPGARKQDDLISEARFKRDWKQQEIFSINPEKFKKVRESQGIFSDDVCNMCGKYCAMKIISDMLKTPVTHF
ncbi:MAG: phosphomethylpyrimidine synthase ThiC [Candidatus Omnitrophica bacterium]|nr:phosphomethylpyrimidine synthase ThiC [Candidatus Omnitrophota bacterium]